MPTGKKSDTLRIRLFSWIPVSSLYSKSLHVSFPASSFSISQLRLNTQLLFDDYNILLSIFKVFFCSCALALVSTKTICFAFISLVSLSVQIYDPAHGLNSRLYRLVHLMHHRIGFPVPLSFLIRQSKQNRSDADPQTGPGYEERCRFHLRPEAAAFEPCIPFITQFVANRLSLIHIWLQWNGRSLSLPPPNL